jgi:outer membrane protein
MRRRWTPLIRAALPTFALALMVRSAFAADVRIGYIDSAKLFQQYTVAIEAQERFDRQVQNWRDEAAEKEKAVKQLRDQVRDQSPILSSLKRQEQEQALQKAISDYEQFVQEIWGPNGRAAAENERSTRELIEQIRAAVEKVAGERGMELVLDAAGGSIIWATKNMDLTADVLTELTNSAAGGGK